MTTLAAYGSVQHMAIYKYFTEEAHAQAFIKGELLLRPLSYFRALEAEEGVRGDANDGTLTYTRPGGIDVTIVGDGRVEKIHSFEAAANDDIFVFCASNSLCADLAKDFGPICVELSDPESIVARLKRRACRKSRFDYEQIISGPVDYRPPEREPGIEWALPEKLTLMKPPSFAGQDEFRIAVGTRSAFDAENVGLKIQFQPGQPAPRAAPAQTHIILSVGSLEEFTTVHVF